jgi:hypothetical protein
VSSGTAQPVAAQQQDVAGQEVDGELIDLRVRLRAERAAEDAAVRVHRRLLHGEAAVADHLTDEGVVVAHLLERSVAQQIGAAVADVDEARRPVVQQERRQRRAHARLLGVLRSALEHGRIGGLRRLEQRPAGGDLGGERLCGKAARHLPCVGAAHAVADDVQGRLHHEGVLVGVAVQPDI